MGNWQPLPPGVGQKVLDAMRLMVRVPLVVVLFAASVAVGTVGVAVIIKLAIFAFKKWILPSW